MGGGCPASRNAGSHSGLIELPENCSRKSLGCCRKTIEFLKGNIVTCFWANEAFRSFIFLTLLPWAVSCFTYHTVVDLRSILILKCRYTIVSSVNEIFFPFSNKAFFLYLLAVYIVQKRNMFYNKLFKLPNTNVSGRLTMVFLGGEE